MNRSVKVCFVLENVFGVAKGIIPISMLGSQAVLKILQQLRRVLVMCFAFSHVEVTLKSTLAVVRKWVLG